MNHLQLKYYSNIFTIRGSSKTYVNPDTAAKLRGESLAIGPKLLSMYTVEHRGLPVRKYWQTGSFKACQMAFRTEFG